MATNKVVKKAVSKKSAGETPVKCWRALTALKVGNAQLDYGDLVPEAISWPNLGLYLRAEQLETVFVTQAEVDRSVKNRTLIEVEEEAQEEKKKSAKKTAKKKVVKRKKEKV